MTFVVGCPLEPSKCECLNRPVQPYSLLRQMVERKVEIEWEQSELQVLGWQ